MYRTVMDNSAACTASYQNYSDREFCTKRDKTNRILYTSIALLVLMTFTVSAIRIDFVVPSQLVVGENVTFLVQSDGKNKYDMKAFIIEDGSIISRTYANTWKSSFYYIPLALTNQATVTVQPTRPTQSASFCVRLRAQGSSTYEERCMPVQVENKTLALPPEEMPLAQVTTPLILRPSASNQYTTRIRTKAYWLEQGIVGATFVAILILLIVLWRKNKRL